MNQLLIEGKKLVLEFNDIDKLYKFVELLKELGITGNVKKKEAVIRYDERFRDYLERDRGLSERTANDYMRYLKKLTGKVINYDLYLEISRNKWMVKCVRLYLDFLYKRGEISWDELQKLKSIFKVKKNTNINNCKFDEEKLIETLYDERLKNEELLLLKIMLYSGIRFSESVKIVNEFDDNKLECFGEWCRYFLGWTRGRKRCDWVYIPVKLVEEIKKHVGVFKNVKVHSLSRRLEKKLGISLKLFRKLHYRVCRSVLDKEVCDFYQNRISNLSIGDIHYDNLLQRADENYPLLTRKINELIERIKEEMIGVDEEVVESKDGIWYMIVPLTDSEK